MSPAMIKRYGWWGWEEFDEKEDGKYVLYTDHIAIIAEKDAEIDKLKQQIVRLHKGMDDLMDIVAESDNEIIEKDAEIERLKREMGGRGFIGYPAETSNQSTPPLEIKK